MLLALYLSVIGAGWLSMPALGQYLKRVNKEEWKEEDWWKVDHAGKSLEGYHNYSMFPMALVVFCGLVCWPATIAGYLAYAAGKRVSRVLAIPGDMLADKKLKLPPKGIGDKDQFLIAGEREVEKLLR